MASPLDIANTVATFVGSRLAVQTQRHIKLAGANILRLSAAEVRAKCRATLTPGPPVHSQANVARFHAVSFATRDQLTPRRLSALSLGVAAFQFQPADLPRGSKLYSEQIQAAGALLQRSLVQMDTGEGKTYVYLPVGFALCCDYATVFIVCANDYLAQRDAKRTRNYWEFVGLNVGLALNPHHNDGWDAPIVYTTLRHLLFRFLFTDLEARTPTVPWGACAALLDEADAILLDQAASPYQLTRRQPDTEADSQIWRIAIQVAEGLREHKGIVVNRSTLTASLTAEMDAQLQRQVNDRQKHSKLRYAIENAYVACHVVQQDVHYVNAGHRLAVVDLDNGKVNPNVVPAWLIALEQKLGLPPRPVDIRMDEVSPAYLLSKLGFVAGASGTLRPDALEYLFAYGLPCVEVNARLPRHDGAKDDLVYKYSETARTFAILETIEILSTGRPVLVAAQTINDAEEFHKAFIEHGLPDGVTMELVTGKNDWDAAAIFAKAGCPNRVTVSTQLAGRGVDIALTESSREAGGLALVCLGHAITRRHDRQILGRAGRQGDPYSSQFFVSLEDELMAMFAGKRVLNLMNSMGMPDDEVIKHTWVTRSIANAQRKLAERAFFGRRQNAHAQHAIRDIRDAYVARVRELQLGQDDDDPCFLADPTSPYLRALVNDFVERHVRECLANVQFVDDRIVENVVEALSLASDVPAWLEDISSAIYGLSPVRALSVITEELFEMLVDAMRIFVVALNENPSLQCCGPRETARLSLAWEWAQFLRERDHIRDTLTGNHISGADFGRRFAVDILNAWEETQTRFSAILIRRLLLAADPAQLCALYERLNTVAPNRPTGLIGWHLTRGVLVEGLDDHQQFDDALEKARVRQHFLVEHFLAEYDLRHLHRARAVRLLTDFLQNNPLVRLRSSERVERAAATAFAELMDDLARSERKEAKQLLTEFLRWLHREGHVASLPSVRARTVGRVRRFIAALASFELIMPVVVVVLLLVCGWAVSALARLRTVQQLSGTAALVDIVLLGGLVQGGSIGQVGLASMLFSRAAGYLVGQKLDRLLAMPVGIVLALYLADWGTVTGNWVWAFGIVGFVLLCITIGTITTRAVWFIEESLDFSLLGVWLAWNCLFGGIALCTHSSPEGLRTVGLLLAATAAQLLIVQTPKVSISLASQTVLNAVSLESRALLSTAVVPVASGLLPHAIGFLFGVSVLRMLLPLGVGGHFTISPAIQSCLGYGVGLGFGVWHSTGRRFSISLWRDLLNRHRQRLKPGMELTSVLRVGRTKALMCEALGFGCACAISLQITSPDMQLAGLPACLVLLAISGIAATSLAAAYRELRSVVLIGATTFQMELLQTPDVDIADASAATRFFMRLKKNSVAWFGLALAIVAELRSDYPWLARHLQSTWTHVRANKHEAQLTHLFDQTKAWLLQHPGHAISIGLGALSAIFLVRGLSRSRESVSAASPGRERKLDTLLTGKNLPKSEPLPIFPPTRGREPGQLELPKGYHRLISAAPNDGPSPTAPPAPDLSTEETTSAPHTVYPSAETPDRRCPCGSGRSFTHCHGQDTDGMVDASADNENVGAHQPIQSGIRPPSAVDHRSSSPMSLKQDGLSAGLASDQQCPCGSGQPFKQCHGQDPDGSTDSGAVVAHTG